MPSNYTPNFNLNQWEADDRVLRTDFNEDNAKLDAALSDLNARLGWQKIKFYDLAISKRGIRLGLGRDWQNYGEVRLLIDAYVDQEVTMILTHNTDELARKTFYPEQNNYFQITTYPFFDLTRDVCFRVDGFGLPDLIYCNSSYASAASVSILVDKSDPAGECFSTSSKVTVYAH